MNGDTWELEIDGQRIAHLEERPKYCNRGRYIARIDMHGIEISNSDPWPRYYFSLTYGMAEVAQWLSAHKVSLLRSNWTLRPAPPGTIDMDALVNGLS
jgi:hypothetical protein